MLLTGTDLLTIERTLQLAIAPAFILGGIMALLSLLSARLQRLADLYEELRSGIESPLTDLYSLARRARLIYRAITFAIGAAVLLCILVIAAFVGQASPMVIALIIGLASWAWGARVTRAQTMSLRRREFIEAHAREVTNLDV